MLDKDLYDSWKSRMKLYMQNREHERMILKSVEHGPLIWPTIEENRVTKTKKYAELSATGKIQDDCDLKATNIILQGLPFDTYSLVNHHRVAKDLWERIQLLMRVNTKFLNSLPPEWSKFMTDVKLVKDLHTTNFDQLHAYPQQHELYANEVRDDPIDVINKMMSFLSTVVTSRFPSTNNHFRNSSNPRQQATIYDGRVTVQPVQGRQTLFAAGMSRTRANVSRTGENNSGQQRVIKCFNCQGEAQGNGKVLNEKELEFLADLGIAEGLVIQTVITHNAAYQADDLDAYDSDYDDFSTSKVVLMANLSSYESDVLFEKNAQFADFEKEINYLKQTLSEQSKENELLTKTFNVLKNESKEKEAKNIDKEIALENKVKELDNIVCKIGQSVQIMHMLTKPQVFYANNLKQALGFQNPFYLKKAQQIMPMLYDGSVIAKETNMISIVDSEETLMLEEESRSKMLLKQRDPMVLKQKVNIKPINYAELNRLSKDFGKRFVPQQELSDEQAFRLQTLHPNTDQSAYFPNEKWSRTLRFSRSTMEVVCATCERETRGYRTTLTRLFVVKRFSISGEMLLILAYHQEIESFLGKGFCKDVKPVDIHLNKVEFHIPFSTCSF
ncbi:hypothetical protein Tco_1262995 [Tanacetum coccineum]